MKYIIHKRFKNKAICGYVNLPATTECDCIENVIIYESKPICYTTSDNAHEYFAINTDGMGMERGKLIQAIRKELTKKDDNYQDRWDKVWTDSICQKYRRKDYDDYWLWNHEFFQADIQTLRYIAKLINAKIV